MQRFGVLELRGRQHGVLYRHRVEQRERAPLLVVVERLDNHPIQTQTIQVADRRRQLLRVTAC